ncbi:CO/xanthine dehydrogenase FAD-binding subunit [Mesorhizobium sp. J18]|uniref:FAD binding domain-containing protein n=1 Tax=Mesorhizobium sp. J18 TaxID=935263 RepID=UPI001199B1F1|nr:xanthine dehydrogenase family protein subunit M [Mesorhizobium sp. J18]TWG97053.1 CO/xanthine dehydrogenase FAD-binding subunit [Mesorhizobium sp. J18]
MARYAKPSSVEEALHLLKQDSWRILAGGTDFYPSLGSRPLHENILDINGLAELRGTSETGTHFVIGARTSWTEVIRHPLPPAFDAFKLAAREVGSIQIQNAGTVAGNLCNASPAADGVPPLLVLDAEVELRSAEGARLVPLGKFILGNRRTVRRPDEIVTAMHVPKRSASGRSAFFKLGARRYLVISIAMAAARVDLNGDGKIKQAAIAVGACSAAAQRLSGLERMLEGLPASSLADAVGRYEFAELSPIDDVRGTAEYRREAAGEIVRRVLAMAAEEGASREIAA